MTRLEFFRQQASEFNNLNDAAVNAWFATALVFLDGKVSSIKESKLDLAIALYAAHLCWIQKFPAKGGASRGPILNEREDKRQREYALIINSNTWLGQSTYGQAFSTLTGIGAIPKASILTSAGVLNYNGCL